MNQKKKQSFKEICTIKTNMVQIAKIITEMSISQ